MNITLHANDVTLLESICQLSTINRVRLRSLMMLCYGKRYFIGVAYNSWERMIAVLFFLSFLLSFNHSTK